MKNDKEKEEPVVVQACWVTVNPKQEIKEMYVTITPQSKDSVLSFIFEDYPQSLETICYRITKENTNLFSAVDQFKVPKLTILETIKRKFLGI